MRISTISRIIASVIFIALLSGLASARTLYVWEGGSHSSGYESWETAANDIQSALDALGAAGADDTILLAPGVYESSSAGDPIFQISGAFIPANSKLTIRAGLGQSELPSGVSPGESLLDGKGESPGIAISLTNTSTDRFLVIDGLAIRNCYTPNDGAAINFASNTSRALGIDIMNCDLSDNKADASGGVIYLVPGGDGPAWLRVENCIFSNNEAVNGHGGALFLNTSRAAVEIKNSVFERNIAKNNPEGNQNGGAIHSTGHSALGAAKPFVLENCRFVRNEAFPSGNANNGGGAVYRVYGTTNIVRNCLFADNSSYRGPAFFYYRFDSCFLFVENCTFANNIGGNGVINLRDQNASKPSTYHLVNCIFSGGNTAIFGGGAAGSGVPRPGSDILVAYCNLPEDPAGTTLGSGDLVHGEGNITDPPLLDEENGYRLVHASPARNAGTNLTWMAKARDLDGNPRIDRVHLQADMGAYEYTYSASQLLIR